MSITRRTTFISLIPSLLTLVMLAPGALANVRPRAVATAWKQFHDQCLSYGRPPIPLVRRAMMGVQGPGALF